MTDNGPIVLSVHAMIEPVMAVAARRKSTALMTNWRPDIDPVHGKSRRGRYEPDSS